MPTMEDRERYARRALELRAMLHATRDPDTRDMLQMLVESYDRLVAESNNIADLKLRLPPSLDVE